jgi:hypothetical protein
MAKVEQPSRVRPPLPRLVEQVRLLLWMQMFLSLIGLLVAIIGAYYVDRRKLMGIGDSYSRLRGLEDRIELLLLGFFAVAVLLAVCAPLVRRRWPPVHVLVLAVEVLAVVVIALAVRVGLAATILVIVYAALTAWIVVDLFRGEVLRYLWRLGR